MFVMRSCRGRAVPGGCRRRPTRARKALEEPITACTTRLNAQQTPQLSESLPTLAARDTACFRSRRSRLPNLLQLAWLHLRFRPDRLVYIPRLKRAAARYPSLAHTISGGRPLIGTPQPVLAMVCSFQYRGASGSQSLTPVSWSNSKPHETRVVNQVSTDLHGRDRPHTYTNCPLAVSVSRSRPVSPFAMRRRT